MQNSVLTYLLAELATTFFGSGLDYDSSYKEYEALAKSVVQSKNVAGFATMKTLDLTQVDNLIDVQRIIAKEKINTGDQDIFDLKLGLTNFYIAVKNVCNDYQPKHLDFKGSIRQEIVPEEAFEFVGHNKELKSTNMSYSYLYE